MEKFWKEQADERWQDVCRLSFVLGFFKGELRTKGYSQAQLDKLEQDATKEYNRITGK